MTEDECVEFCKRAVGHAMARDGSSGGCVRLVVVTQEGARSLFVPHTDALKCYGERNLPLFTGFSQDTVMT
jgi:20S proteasome subunit beta 1